MIPGTGLSTCEDGVEKRGGISLLRWLFLECWSKDPTRNPVRKLFAMVFLCGILVYCSWISLNFYTYHRLYTDSGVFASVSHHLLSGKILYREVWDHKPPMIYVLNTIPIVWGDGSVLSIRFYERLYAIWGILSLFFSILMIFKSPLLAFIASIAFQFHFFNPEVFQGGNLTEEYGAMFVLGAIWIMIVSVHCTWNMSRLWILAAGLLFSLAVFCKETFLFSALAWILFLCIHPHPDRIPGYKRVAWFWGGAMIPALGFGLVGIWQGNLGDWLDVISFNLHYAGYSQKSLSMYPIVSNHLDVITRYVAKQTFTFHLCFLLGLASACYLPFVKKYAYIPWILVLAFGMDFIATMISGFEIGHYYLQIVPSYIWVATCGGAWVLSFFSSKKIGKFAILPVLILFFLLMDSEEIGLYRLRMRVPASQAPVGMISKKINEMKQAGDTLWAGRGENAKYYQETRVLSPSKYLYVYDHLFLDTRLSTGEEKRKELMKEIIEHSPTFLILSSKDFAHFPEIGLGELVVWIQKNYSKVPGMHDGENELFLHHESTS